MKHALATPFRDRGGAGIRAQRGIIALGQRAGRLGEHRGGHHSSDAWQGPENFDVTMLARLAVGGLRRRQLSKQAIDLAFGLEPLLVHQDQLGHQRGNAGRDGVGDTGGDRQRAAAAAR